MINIKNPPNFGGFSSLRVSPLKILTKGRAFGNRKPLKRLDLNFMVFFFIISALVTIIQHL